MKINKKNFIVFMLLNLAFLIYSISSVVAKVNSASNEVLSIGFCILFAVQLCTMVIYTILWQFSIKSIDLNIAFSMKATTIVWSLIFARYIFNESITFNNIVGVVIIIVGIMVVVKK